MINKINSFIPDFPVKQAKNSTTENNKEAEMEILISSTSSFEKAINNNDVQKAEDWLNNIKNNPNEFPQYDERWVDHRERALFKKYCSEEDWEKAKRIANSSIKESSKEGRLARINELSQQS